MSDCAGTDQCSVELASLPLLTNCPADDEWMLFGNAVGGAGKYKYARRTWAKIKECIGASGGSYTALSDTITSDSSTYTNAALIGASELKFVIVNKQLYTYEDGDFAFNDNTGVVVFLTITLFTNDTITIPFKSA